MKRVTRTVFPLVLKKGHVFHAPHISLRVISAPETVESAFAFVVSRKVTNMAVKRNLLKRRGRHIVREATEKLKNKYTGVFFFKKDADSLSFEELQEEIASLLSHARIGG